MPTRAVVFAWLLLAPTCAFAQAPPRVSVPGDVAMAKATAQVAAVYRTDYESAKTTAEKKALIKKLLEDARNTKEDPAARLAVFRVAASIAGGIGDVQQLEAIVDLQATHFEIDPLLLKVELLEKAAANIKTELDHFLLTRIVDRLAPALGRADQWKLASQTLALAESSARKVRDADLVKVYAAQAKDLPEQQAAVVGLPNALAALEKSPTGAETNEAAGKLLCFASDDWSRGLPMLALAGDKELQACAEQELRGVTGADRVKLADAWYKLGQSQAGVTQRNIWRHALTLYQQEQPQLTGLQRTRVDKVVSELFASTMPDRVPLVTIKPSRYSVHAPHNGPSFEGHVAGYRFPESVWAHAPNAFSSSSIVFELPCDCKYLTGWYAFHGPAQIRSFVIFRANGSTREVFRIKGHFDKVHTLVPFRIDLRNQERIELIVDCPGDHFQSGTIWVTPMLQK